MESMEPTDNPVPAIRTPGTAQALPPGAVNAAGESLARATGGVAAMVEHLRALSVAQVTYESVVTVEDAGVQPTFDVMLPPVSRASSASSARSNRRPRPAFEPAPKVRTRQFAGSVPGPAESI